MTIEKYSDMFHHCCICSKAHGLLMISCGVSTKNIKYWSVL